MAGFYREKMERQKGKTPLGKIEIFLFY